MQEQSSLFRRATQQELTAACRHYLGETLENAQLLSGGLFNTTYLLETPSRKAILRLGPVNRHLLLPYECHLMEAEPAILELLHRGGIPTSRLIAVDTGKGLLDRDIMVLEYIDAVSMSTIKVPPEREAAICRTAGEWTRRIHGISADALPGGCAKPFGRAALVLTGQGGGSWAEALEIELAQWREQAEKVALFSCNEFEQINACFQAHMPLFRQAALRPCLVHGDLWYGNLLIDAEGHLAAIIDADRAMFGDPEFELATGWMISPDFCRGYGGEPEPSPEAVRRRGMYQLLLNLEDCYIYRNEYNDPDACERLRAAVLVESARMLRGL